MDLKIFADRFNRAFEGFDIFLGVGEAHHPLERVAARGYLDEVDYFDASMRDDHEVDFTSQKIIGVCCVGC